MKKPWNWWFNCDHELWSLFWIDVHEHSSPEEIKADEELYQTLVLVEYWNGY